MLNETNQEIVSRVKKIQEATGWSLKAVASQLNENGCSIPYGTLKLLSGGFQNVKKYIMSMKIALNIIEESLIGIGVMSKEDE